MPRGLSKPTEDSPLEYIERFIRDRYEKIKEASRKSDRWMKQIEEANKLRKEKENATHDG